jgi:short subunit fatty acids transporter
MFYILNNYLMFKKSILLAFSLLFFGMVSCKEDEVMPSNMLSFDVMLSGVNEVPANNSKATGMLMGTYNKDSKMLSYTLTYSGMTATAGHFHKAAAGSNGGVAVDLGSISTGMKNTLTLTDAQVTDLMAGMWYINLHSAAFPSGELRGQVMLK